MPPNDRTNCPRCGEAVRPGERSCPNGHALDPAAETGAAATPGSSDTLTRMLRLDRETSSPLFECRPCGRLVELPDEQGAPVVPPVCPACGERISSILGRELDGFRLEEVISRGGFGIVYLASNITQPKMKAVVKILRPELGHQRPELIKIFIEEARLTEEISQTCWNVVKVFNVRERPWPYFFMEYIRGITLDAVIEAAGGKHIPIEDCKGYLRGIARALAATHAHGRVHRDLKPLNIMVIQKGEISRPEDRIKLLDFGLSMKIASARAGLRQTDHSASGISSLLREMDSPILSAGTPDYMPPESFDGINEFGGDIYSFGVTTYELLTRERPWKDPAVGTERFFFWRETHKKTPPRPVRKLRSDIPGRLAKVVMQCLEKDPRRRIKTADELLDRLKDPVSKWMWASLAAGAVLVAVLVMLALRGPTSVVVTGWTVNDEPRRGSSLELWVTGEADFAGKQIAALSSTGLAGVDFEVRRAGGSAVESVEYELSEDGKSVLLHFASAPSPLAGEFTLVGSGAGIVIEGKFQVLVDDSPPEVGRLHFLAPGAEPAPVERGQILGPDVPFMAKIVEVNPDRVSLHLKGGGEREISVAAEPSGRDDLPWRFRPERLEEEKYLARVVAVDRADNRSEGPGVEIEIDRTVLLTIPARDAQSYTALGRLFYTIFPDEPLERVSATLKSAAGTDREVDCKLYLNPGSTSSVELGEKLSREKEKLSVLPSEILKGESYLLAIASPRSREGAAADADEDAIKVLVADRARPPNTKSFELRWKPPSPLERADIVKVVFAGKKEKMLSGKDLAAGRGSAADPQPFPEDYLRELRIHWGGEEAEGRVHGARLEFGREQREAWCDRKDPTKVILTGIQLPDETTILPVTLFGPLNESLVLRLALRKDLQRPAATIRKAYAHPGQFLCSSWKDVALSLAAGEPLAKATLTLAVLGRSVGVDGSSRDRLAWSFDLSALEVPIADAEGTHELEFRLEDLAGNEAGMTDRLAVNLGPPRLVRTVPPVRDGLLTLNDRDLVLEVADGNRIDEKKAEIALAGWTERYPLQRDAGNYKAVFATLEENWSGLMAITVADEFGSELRQEVRLHFKPTVPWEAAVDHGGVRWILVRRDDGGYFYISKTEISNRVFRALGAPELRRQARPPLWGPEDSFPSYYNQPEGRWVPGDDFPVVGVTPNAAEAFARGAFGGRLPTVDEWRRAARLDGGASEGSRYPWKDIQEGRRICHSRYVDWNKVDSPFNRHHFYGFRRGGRTPDASPPVLNYGPVEVDYDPIAEVRKSEPEFPKKLGFGGTIVHVLGNAGEIVRTEGGYRVAGGSVRTRYDDIDINRTVPAIEGDLDTGIRIVIDPEDGDADPAFVEKARYRPR